VTVAVVIGNPNPGGRTTAVGKAVGNAIAAARGGDDVVVIELATIASHLFDWDNDDVKALTEQVASANVIVAACPTYKATYTGLLKAFLDQYGTDGLAGCQAVPVMVGAAPNHALAPEVHLRPLLVELGASVPTRGLYMLDTAMDTLDDVVSSWAATAGPLLA
jgi:FMN reductase